MRLSSPFYRISGGALHQTLLLLVLLLSAIAGRQLFMDGMTNVVQSLHDPLWHPFDQETPRRLFALIWSTVPVRFVSLASPLNIKLAAFLYGLAAYAQIAIPLILVLRSNLLAAVKSLLVILFVSATLFLANFVATELLFALGLTTVFVVYSLDSDRDPKYVKRIVVAVLLAASYEVVALSNALLAIGICFSPRQELNPTPRRWLVAILLLALPFQLACFFSEPTMPGQNVFNRFVFEIAGIAALAVTFGILAFKAIERASMVQAAMIVACFTLPIALLWAPDLIGLRTREFQYAYPSRISSAGVTVLIALLPILLNQRLWRWPTRLLGWIGIRPLGNMAAATLAAFYGISILASIDAFSYRQKLGEQLAQFSGLVAVEGCGFCSNPEKFGYPNLGEPSHWPAYSMAHRFENIQLPPLVVFAPGHLGDIGDDQIVAFLHNGQLKPAAKNGLGSSDFVPTAIHAMRRALVPAKASIRRDLPKDQWVDE